MPFRPSNINKRLYPGNGSVIGPTVTPTCGVSTTVCCTFISNIGFTTTASPVLGCRTQPSTCCYCPCCSCCPCIVTTRTVPSGMWKSSEQWDASIRDAWGPPTSATGPTGTLCGPSASCALSPVDCKAFYLGNDLWVSPYCTQSPSNAGGGPAINCAISVMSYNTGWFYGSYCTWFECAYPCRTYWDNYDTGPSVYYGSNTSTNLDGTPSPKVWWTDMANGTFGYEGSPNSQTQIWCGRAFRKSYDVPQNNNTPT